MALYANLAFVTVMDVQAYLSTDTLLTASPTAVLDCLTISNITQEGPRKEARGGLNASPCIRYGKTARLEMEDVVLRNDALEIFFDVDPTDYAAGDLSFTETFAKGIQLVGKTYIVDKTTGDRKTAYITFYDFLPDSNISITMESEGDIGMISLAGELFANSSGKFFTISETDPTDGNNWS
jgi:hypothetical protein